MSNSMKPVSVLFIYTKVIQKSDYLLDFLRRESGLLAEVAMYKTGNNDDKPECTVYIDGQLKDHFYPVSISQFLVKSYYGGARNPLYFLYYLDHLIVMLHVILRIRKRFDLFLGIGFYYCFWGVLFRIFHLVKRTIYYRADYFERDTTHFYADIISRIFLLVDRFILSRADAVWNLTRRMRDKSQCGCKSDVCRHRILKPIGMVVYKEFFQSKVFDGIHLLYMGQIELSKGLDLVVEAIAGLTDEFPGIRLHVVGAGPEADVENVKTRIAEKRIERHVVFHGPLKKGPALDKILKQCDLGVALYKPLNFKYFTWYTEPGKIKEYFSYGLPVITTSIAEIADEIEKWKIGIVTDYSVEALQNAFLFFARDRGNLKTYVENVLLFANAYTPDKIMGGAFKETFRCWAEER